MAHAPEKIEAATIACLLLLIAVGCGAGVPLGDLMPSPSKFDLRDIRTGNLTHYATSPLQSTCEPGVLMDTLATKDTADAYWANGVPGAWVRGALKRLNDGAWVSVAAQVHTDIPNQWGHYDATLRLTRTSGTHGYMIVPSPGMAAAARFHTLEVTGKDEYRYWLDVLTYDCPSSPPDLTFGPTRWTSKIYWEQVDTPVFKGLAVVNEQFEGCTPEQEKDPTTTACPHEKWYFAPGIGVVEINSLWNNAHLKRIN